MEKILGLLETIAAGTRIDGVMMWLLVGFVFVRADEDVNKKCGEDSGVSGEGRGRERRHLMIRGKWWKRRRR